MLTENHSREGQNQRDRQTDAGICRQVGIFSSLKMLKRTCQSSETKNSAVAVNVEQRGASSSSSGQKLTSCSRKPWTLPLMQWGSGACPVQPEYRCRSFSARFQSANTRLEILRIDSLLELKQGQFRSKACFWFCENIFDGK